MILFSSCIAYTAFAWLSVNVTPAQLATYGFVNPVIAILLGWWVLDERLGALRIIGTLIVLGGLLLIHTARTPSSTATAAQGASR
jgi:drug/metabolite transporter (DMT)-like permease